MIIPLSIGHVFWKDTASIARGEVDWKPKGKRKRETLKTI